MNKETFLVEEFAKNAVYRMDESTRMIQRSLGQISEREAWLKPNESLNSIANLILHVCGNITQYIIASLGESEDARERDLEFSTSKGYDKYELMTKLEETVEKAKGIIKDADLEQLLKIREVQGFSLSGAGVILHVVEHYSYHTGQIAFWVKQLKNKDLGFYEGRDLNTKNK
ncbi:MAG: DUF1572 family protein [Maribacter sp.]|nr:DUF1572 family protein [Maribacter sp.]